MAINVTAIQQLEADEKTTGLSIDAAAAQLNTQSETIQEAADNAKLLQWAASVGAWTKFEAGLAVPQLKDMCESGLAILRQQAIPFNTGDAGNEAMMDALIGAGIFDAADKTALWALGAVPKSPAELAGVSPLKPGHIEKARAA